MKNKIILSLSLVLSMSSVYAQGLSVDGGVSNNSASGLTQQEIQNGEGTIVSPNLNPSTYGSQYYIEGCTEKGGYNACTFTDSYTSSNNNQNNTNTGDSSASNNLGDTVNPSSGLSNNQVNEQLGQMMVDGTAALADKITSMNGAVQGATNPLGTSQEANTSTQQPNNNGTSGSNELSQIDLRYGNVPGGDVFTFCAGGRPGRHSPWRSVYDYVCAGNPQITITQ